MIFNGSQVTAMVMQWQQTRDAVLLERILDSSKSLVEAIISGYGTHNREDLIQDAIAKIIFSLPYYSPGHGSLHNYLTTVIRNSSATVYNKEARHDCDKLELSIIGNSQYVSEEDILQELIIFARIRFPSLPVNLIDNIAEYIYSALQYEHTGKGRGIVSALVIEYGISRNIAYVIYNSMLIFLRNKYMDYCEPITQPSEFSIMSDLKMLLGDTEYNKVATIFSSMYLKFS